ncbi:MAG: hypothetical protein ACKVZJ_07220 [Phycisphaerales bacterium]
MNHERSRDHMDAQGIDHTTFVGAGGRASEAALAARLLNLGIRGPIRPVDRLVERLRNGDRQRWVEGVLAEIERAIQPGARDLLLTGRHGASAPLELLRHIKERCKKQAARAEPGKEPLEPMLGYFLAVAAALAHHNALISSVSRSEIDGVLLDLACELPDPWVDLLCRATLAEAGA